MDAMDVLGALLGKKSGSGSPGGNILKDILGGGGSSARRPAPPQPRRTPAPQQGRRPKSIGEAARSLEDLLNVSNSRHAERHPQTRPSQTRQPQTRQPQAQRSPAPDLTPAPQRRYTPPEPAEQDALNEQSVVLIRAMISAAKSDGQITQEEQQAIVGQLGHLSENELNFLRDEFARPVDVRELAWNTPLGLEEQVYSMSLIAIDLDENKEAEYLADLAHGLRMQPKRCNQLHQKYNAPEIFRV